ncbi:MAG: hypothetical protein WKF52_09775 [Sphingomicrobium sp.]
MKRPTGPPTRSPIITADIAAMKPPNVKPKVTTMVFSSALDQPPYINSAIIVIAIAPQNMPAAQVSQP